MAESEENETVMMCWEDLEDSPGKEPHEESDHKTCQKDAKTKR